MGWRQAFKVGTQLFRGGVLRLVGAGTASVSMSMDEQTGDVVVTVTASGGSPSPTVTSETSHGQAAAAGSAATYARGDHTHGTPPMPTAAEVGADPAGTGASQAASAVSAHVGAADPHAQYQREVEKGAAGGYAALDDSGRVPHGQVTSASDGQYLRLQGSTIVGATLALGIVVNADVHPGFVAGSIFVSAGELV